MKTTHALAIVFGIVSGIVLFFYISHNQPTFSSPVIKKAAHLQPTDTPMPTPTAEQVFSAPVRIRIPKIHVDTTVEKVGNTTDGRMDVPKGINNTAWYEPGYKPGQKGSAVIDGHYDTPTGAPGIFYDIGKLAPGDMIEITDEQNKTLTFKVSDKKTLKDATFPIQDVFAKNDQPRLNLITCSGTWDKTAKNYSDRLVVYSVLE